MLPIAMYPAITLIDAAHNNEISSSYSSHLHVLTIASGFDLTHETSVQFIARELISS